MLMTGVNGPLLFRQLSELFGFDIWSLVSAFVCDGFVASFLKIYEMKFT